MPLRKQKGNMYPWVTHMHSHLAGECPHKCAYCYVQTNPHGVSPRWKGPIRLIRSELNDDYSRKWWDEKDKKWKTEKTIFIEHMSDLFAYDFLEGIDPRWVYWILDHCKKYPQNTYVLQTKNTERAYFARKGFPPKFMIGTTLETNRAYKIGNAPSPLKRYIWMLKFIEVKTFVTVEPIMDFDLEVLVGWLQKIKPDFVNIGADSKGCNLPEPSPEKVKALISEVQKFTEIRNKRNLNRILK